MIITGLSDAVFYRMNTPRWAFTPTSGAGAARQGGRLNRAGVEALYLSKETDTAVAEFRQTSPILPPGMLVSYLVSAARVVDFSAGFHVGWDPYGRTSTATGASSFSTTRSSRRPGCCPIW